MGNKILRELSLQLDTINDKPQVGYILIIVRKLLEQHNAKLKFPILTFYTSWVLHYKIDRTAAINKTLDQLEEAIISEKYNSFPLFDIVSFEKFFSQLRHFLDSIGVSNKFGENKYCHVFRQKLVSILLDCPLEPIDRKITRITFTNVTENDIDVLIELREWNKLPTINAKFNFQP